MVRHTKSERETEAFGEEVAPLARAPSVIGLVGELGCGKTVFVRGLVKGLAGDPSQVHSPTFTLLNIYQASVPVYHFDLYRLSSEEDLEGIGFYEFLSHGVSVIEWADRIPRVLEMAHMIVKFEFGKGEDDRVISLSFRKEANPWA